MLLSSVVASVAWPRLLCWGGLVKKFSFSNKLKGLAVAAIPIKRRDMNLIQVG